MMEEIDKDLATLLDIYNEKFEANKGQKEKKIKERDDFDIQFKKLIVNVIKPEMDNYKELLDLLDKKGLHSYIKIEPQFELEDRPPRITFTFSYKKSKHSSSSLPSITLAAGNGKIELYENRIEPTGSGSSGREGSYEMAQITNAFVKELLSKFFKSLFNKSWTQYDFE